VTRACFCDTGRVPDCNEALQIAATTGANSPAACLTSHVGVFYLKEIQMHSIVSET